MINGSSTTRSKLIQTLMAKANTEIDRLTGMREEVLEKKLKIITATIKAMLPIIREQIERVKKCVIDGEK